MRHTGLMGTGRGKRAHAESGQIMVLVALMAIGLIAFIGLAIDGGRLLHLQRQEQNAADAAVLASVLSLCSGGTDAEIIAAGEEAAQANGFTNGEAETTVVIDPEPEGMPENTCANCSVSVKITSEIPSYFIAVVYSGPLSATTRAVASCYPDNASAGSGGPSTPGNCSGLTAVWTGATTCPSSSLKWSGSTNQITGGLHSNDDIHISGQTNDVYGCSCFSTNIDPAGANDKIDWHEYGGGGEEEDEEDLPVCGSDCDIEDPEEEEGGTCTQPNQAGPYGTDDNPAYPVSYDIANYQPGGTAALAADADPNAIYVHFTDCNNPNDKMTMGWLKDEGYFNDGTKILQTGVYYSDCGIHLSDSDMIATATFVAVEEIDLSGSKTDLTPYIDNLMFFTIAEGANKCESAVIKLAGSVSHIRGIVFSPNGNTQLSGSTNLIEGCIVGYTSDIAGSTNQIICDPGEGTTSNTIGNSE